MAVNSLAAGSVAGAITALLLMGAWEATFNTWSTLESSPWTSENFGADQEKASSAKEYMVHAVVVSVAFGGLASYVSHSPWPIIGVLAADVYLIWIYLRALRRAVDTGSTGWSSSSGDSSSVAAPNLVLLK